MGSLIWNSAKHHRNLIQQRNFWEVKNGNTERFWEDSWQQMPKLKDQIALNQPLEQEMQSYDKVKNFWRNSPTQEYQEWLKADQILRQGSTQVQQILDTELTKRRIQHSNEKDILRWGYEEIGTYSMREACNIIIKAHTVKDPLWSIIWDPSIWPKISTFLWLLCHNKILTWDNLRKRNFHGPSIFPNCRQEEETIKHLMMSCYTAQALGKGQFPLPKGRKNSRRHHCHCAQLGS